MYEVGNIFHEAAKGFNRQVVVRVTFNDVVTVGGDYLQKVTIKDVTNSGNELTIGNTCSNQLDLVMRVPGGFPPEDIKTAKIFVEVGFLSVTNALNAIDTQLYVDEILGYLYQEQGTDGLQFSLSNGELVVQGPESPIAVTLKGNEVEVSDNSQDIADFTYWLPFGVFYTDSATSKDNYRTVSITAFDGMSLIEHITERFSSGKFRKSPTAPEVIEEIAGNIGVDVEIPEGLPNENVQITRAAYSNDTYRNMLGYLAGFLGCNAHFTRTGTLTVKPYSSVDFLIDREQQYMNSFNKSADEPVTIRSITSKTNETDSDLSRNLSFQYGWFNATSGTVVEERDSQGNVCFVTKKIPVLAGASYKLTRSAAEKSSKCRITVYGFKLGKGGEKPHWQDDEFLTYAAPMSNTDLEWNFTINQAEANFILIQVTAPDYRTEQRGGYLYYEILHSYTLTRIVADGGITLGSGYGMTMVNPLIFTAAQLQPVFELYNGLSYLPATLKYRADPSLDSGDIISAEKADGSAANLIITSQIYKISGGMNCTITSSGVIDSSTAASSTQRYGAGASPTNQNQKLLMMIEQLQEKVAELEGANNSN